MLVCGSIPRSSARSQVHATYDVKSSWPYSPRRARHLGVHLGALPREHQQLLHPAARGVVQHPLDLVRRVQVRLVCRKSAVLAVALARAGEGDREVPREGDPPHRSRQCRHSLPRHALTRHPARPRCRARHRRLRRRRLQLAEADPAGPRLHAQRGARGHLHRAGAGARQEARREAGGARAVRLHRLAHAAAHGPGGPLDRGHPRPRTGAREGRGPGGRGRAGHAAAGRGDRRGERDAPARPAGPARGRDRPAVRHRRAEGRGAGRRRRLRARQARDDRLLGGARPDRREGGRRHRLLERRGRDPEAARREHARLPRGPVRRAALSRARDRDQAQHAGGQAARDRERAGAIAAGDRAALADPTPP